MKPSKSNCPRFYGWADAIINIHPNPTSGILNIESMEFLKKIEVFNILGSLVGVYENEKQIDISILNAELYLIRFTSESGVEQRRVEVSR
ncbi:MAG: T9SS type A sorting domain-containing protein [Bacteroidota bacterium]